MVEGIEVFSQRFPNAEKKETEVLRRLQEEVERKMKDGQKYVPAKKRHDRKNWHDRWDMTCGKCGILMSRKYNRFRCSACGKEIYRDRRGRR